MAINQEEIIGMLLPYVSINRVTLESSGFTRTEDNPHIDSPLENPLPDNPSGLRVRLDLFLKDMIDDDAISTWFSQQDFAKYISLKVFQSVDPRITGVLSAGREMISLADPDTVVRTSDPRNSVLVAALNVDNIEDARDILFRKTEYKKLSLKSDMLGSSSKLSQHGAKVDSDGNKVFEINYPVSFEIPELAPEHLSYFVMTSLDIEALAKDFDLDIQTINLYRMNGNLVSEVVIDNYATKSESTLYYTEDGETWAGPMHKYKGKFKTGFEEAPSSRQLSKTTVLNTVVQDFRVPEAIEGIPIEFMSYRSIFSRRGIAGSLNSAFKSPIRNNDNRDVSHADNYFSDMFLTRDENNNAKFLFAANLHSLILNNTVYGDLIRGFGPSAFEELVRDTKILSLKIWRRRVKTPPRISNDIGKANRKKVKELNVNDSPPELIVVTGERGTRKIVEVEDYKSHIRESNLSVTGDLGIRYFTGVDKTARQLSSGKYQYGVEIEISDSSVDFFKKHLSSLADAKKMLQGYYSEATTPTMSKYLAEVNDPHIDHPDEFAGTYGNTYGGWDPLLGRFSQSFIRNMKKKYADNPSKSPWIMPVAAYLNTLNMFTNVMSTPGPRRKLIMNLGMYTNPKTATPKSIRTAIRLIDNLSAKIEDIMKTTEKPTRHSISSVQNSLNLETNKGVYKSVSVEKYLSGIYNASLNSKSVFDYLGSAAVNKRPTSSGLAKITSEQWAARIDSETQRFFNGSDSNINMANITDGDSISNTDYSFLSPAAIHFPQVSVSLIEGEPDSVSTPIDKTPQDADRFEGKLDKRIRNITSYGISASKKMTEIQSDIVRENYSTFSTGLVSSSPPSSGKNYSLASEQATYNSMDSYFGAAMNMSVDPFDISVVGSTNEPSALKIDIKPPQDLSDVVAPCNENIVDGVVDVGKQGDKNKKSNLEDVSGANVFFGTLMNTLSISGVTNENRDVQVDTLRKTSAAAGAAPYEKTSISYFNLQNLKKGKGAFFGNGYKITPKEIKQMPNQLKSLYLASLGSSDISRNVMNLASSLQSKEGGAISSGAEFNFTFGMISRVEFLAGFEVTPEGNVVLGEGVWAQLTKDRYNSLAGEEILCRFKDYEKIKLGIRRNRGMKNVVSNKYFVLTPKKIEKKFTAPSVVPAVVANVVRDTNQDFEATPRPAVTDFNSFLVNTLAAIDCETDNVSSSDTQTNTPDVNELPISGVNCLNLADREILQASIDEASQMLEDAESKINNLNNQKQNLKAAGLSGRDLAPVHREIVEATAVRDEVLALVNETKEKLKLVACPDDPALASEADPCPPDPSIIAAADGNISGLGASATSGGLTDGQIIAAGGLIGGAIGLGAGVLLGGAAGSLYYGIGAPIGAFAGGAIGLGIGAAIGSSTTAAVLALSDDPGGDISNIASGTGTGAAVGAAVGAVTGGAAGAVVGGALGGPVGAVAGGTVGAAAGAATGAVVGAATGAAVSTAAAVLNVWGN